MAAMNLRLVRLDDATAVRCEFQLETTGKNRFCYTLIARFVGEYRSGCAGRPDAAFIVGMATTAVELWHPAALVLDLSQLRYEWGDEMASVLTPDVPCKVAIVVGPGCGPAIATLMWGLNTNRNATEADGIFDCLEAAWEAVRHREWER